MAASTTRKNKEKTLEKQRKNIGNKKSNRGAAGTPLNVKLTPPLKEKLRPKRSVGRNFFLVFRVHPVNCHESGFHFSLFLDTVFAVSFHADCLNRAFVKAFKLFGGV